MKKEKIVAEEEGDICGLMLSLLPDTVISKAKTKKATKNPIPHHKSIKNMFP